MELLKCKMCGGDIELSADKTIGVCDSCGCSSTLPKIDDEQRVGLFNRGNTLRMRGEFDKAAAVFERIIEQDELDAEAHWCLALCRYGIEYVEDPKSGERIPTSHRTSYDLFLNDADYVSAIEHSDSYTANLYTTQAKRITEIQRAILAISKQEEPFDVFICYKETTDQGDRTKDSALAQDIYYELTNAGYKVFFSRITLEEKLGTEYEPYIFAALNSAKVMIVIGTSADNFNAVWVKNEWSRFLSLMKADRSRMLIPCYRDMDPYDLPDELAMLQSQDMSKIGFIQDITRGIEKILESTTTKTVTKTSSEVGSTDSLERLIQNSYTYLRLDNYTAAQEVFNRITKEYPEDYRGWWGLIVCKTEGFSFITEDLSTLNTWFKYVKQLSTADESAPLETEYLEYTKIKTYVDHRNQVNAEKKRKKEIYRNQAVKHEEVISEAQNIISNYKTGTARYRKGIVYGGVAVVIGLWLFFNVLASFRTEDYFVGVIFHLLFMAGGIIVAISGISVIFGSIIKLFSTKKAKNDAHASSSKANAAKTNIKNQYDAEVRKLDKQIQEINSDIAQAEKRIADCKKTPRT